jgi:PDZ domain-containing protein
LPGCGRAVDRRLARRIVPVRDQDLTRGRTIAGTGAIDLDGNISPIGGIADKVLGAQDAGADILLVPRANLQELRGVDTGDLRLIPVATFDEAVDALTSSQVAA